MKKNQYGFSFILILVLILLIGIVGFAGLRVMQNRNKTPSTPTIAREDQDTTTKEVREDSPVREGWKLQKSTYGDIYLPSTEGDLNLTPQTDDTSDDVNDGQSTELTTYDLHFYELSKPIFQYKGGFFNPCKYDYENNKLSPVSVKLKASGETFTSSEQSCNSTSVKIASKDFVDFSYIYEARYQASYMTTNAAKTVALQISNKQYSDTECYMGTKDQDICDQIFEKSKTDLKTFLAEFVASNGAFFEN